MEAILSTKQDVIYERKLGNKVWIYFTDDINTRRLGLMTSMAQHNKGGSANLFKSIKRRRSSLTAATTKTKYGKLSMHSIRVWSLPLQTTSQHFLLHTLSHVACLQWMSFYVNQPMTNKPKRPHNELNNSRSKKILWLCCTFSPTPWSSIKVARSHDYSSGAWKSDYLQTSWIVS